MSRLQASWDAPRDAGAQKREQWPLLRQLHKLRAEEDQLLRAHRASLRGVRQRHHGPRPPRAQPVSRLPMRRGGSPMRVPSAQTDEGQVPTCGRPAISGLPGLRTVWRMQRNGNPRLARTAAEAPVVECAGPETGPVNEFSSAMVVALEAQRLVELRDRWLNPPEWVEWVDETEIPLSANGQAAQFIHEMFPGTDTSDFVGSVRCTVSGGAWASSSGPCFRAAWV